MPAGLSKRVFGVETEFGTLVSDGAYGSPENAVEIIKDVVFDELKLGVIDQHARDDVFEPARSGGFLLNGARLYVDAVGSHLEYATAECQNLKDLVSNDRAGQRQIVRAIQASGLAGIVSVYNNSVDHFGGHTFGCHENYLVRQDDEILNTRAQLLYPFLVTRQIFAGVGRVGGHLLTQDIFRPAYEQLMENPIDYIWVSQVYGVQADPNVDFQLSQRADHILKTMASRVRFNRAIINPKWETYYSHNGLTRLHLLYGEANQSEYAYALKIGTTCLVLRMLEDDRIPVRLSLAAPLQALRVVSRDRSHKWRVILGDGTTISAIDLQREYLKLAEKYRGASSDTDWTLDQWAEILDGLENDPMKLEKRLDWVAKLRVLEEYMGEVGVNWSDDALHSVDLEYHNIDPETSLFHALEMERMTTDMEVLDAMTDPPTDTRAKVRSELIREILNRKSRGFYMVDWNGVALDRERFIELADPFVTKAP